MHFQETDYGFEYGSAKVNRIHSDDKKGYVILGVSSPKGSIQIYVTKTGKIRVWHNGKEMR